MTSEVEAARQAAWAAHGERDKPSNTRHRRHCFDAGYEAGAAAVRAEGAAEREHLKGQAELARRETLQGGSSAEEREPYKLEGEGSTPSRPTTYPRGDGPCDDCGMDQNFVWFTDSVFWNAVIRSEPDYVEPILCVHCFAARSYAKGYRNGWRLLPDFHWENVRDVPGDETHLPSYVRDRESGAQTPDSEGIARAALDNTPSEAK